MSISVMIDGNKILGRYVKIEIYLEGDNYNPSHEMYADTHHAHEICKTLSHIPNCNRVNIVAMARIIHVYQKGTLVKSRSLSDFYDNLTAEDLAYYRINIPPRELKYTHASIYSYVLS